MHPDISSFPAAEFYAGQLLDGPEVRRGAARAWHDHRVRARCPTLLSHSLPESGRSRSMPPQHKRGLRPTLPIPYPIYSAAAGLRRRRRARRRLRRSAAPAASARVASARACGRAPGP